MISVECAIHKYIDAKRKLQKLVLQIIDKPDSGDEDIQKLLIYLDTQQYEGKSIRTF